MFKVTISWAGLESEEYLFESRKEAWSFIQDAAPPYGNIKASIKEVQVQEDR